MTDINKQVEGESMPFGVPPSIRDLLAQRDKEIIEMVEERKRKEYRLGEFLEHRTEYNEGYSTACDDIITAISKRG